MFSQLIAELPGELHRHHVLVHLDPAEMAVLRHVLLGRQLVTLNDSQLLDVSKYSAEFIRWCLQSKLVTTSHMTKSCIRAGRMDVYAIVGSIPMLGQLHYAAYHNCVEAIDYMVDHGLGFTWDVMAAAVLGGCSCKHQPARKHWPVGKWLTSHRGVPTDYTEEFYTRLVTHIEIMHVTAWSVEFIAGVILLANGQDGDALYTELLGKYPEGEGVLRAAIVHSGDYDLLCKVGTNQHCMHLALLYDQVDIAQQLYDSGYDEFSHCIGHVMETGTVETFKWAVYYSSNDAIVDNVHHAIEAGRIDILQLCMEIGWKPRLCDFLVARDLPTQQWMYPLLSPCECCSSRIYEVQERALYLSNPLMAKWMVGKFPVDVLTIFGGLVQRRHSIVQLLLDWQQVDMTVRVYGGSGMVTMPLESFATAQHAAVDGELGKIKAALMGKSTINVNPNNYPLIDKFIKSLACWKK